MSSYQEGGGSHEDPSGTGGAHESGGYPEGSPQYTGGGGYESGSYGGGPAGQTSQFPHPGGQQQQWPGQQYQGQPGYQGQQGYEGYQGQHGYQGQQGGGLQSMFQGGGRNPVRHVRSTFKTTEFWIYLVAVLALLIASAVTDEGPDNQGFGAQEAWKYVTWLTVAYLISRGLTKFGGHESNRDHHHHDSHDSHDSHPR